MNDKRKAAVEALREKIAAKLADKRNRRVLVKANPPPRYDRVFEEGVANLL